MSQNRTGTRKGQKAPSAVKLSIIYAGVFSIRLHSFLVLLKITVFKETGTEKNLISPEQGTDIILNTLG